MSLTLGEPLIAAEAASSDPFYAFRDELKSRVDSANVKFEDWKDLLENTDTTQDRHFRTLNEALKKNIPQLQSSITDLEQVVSHVSNNRAQFPHIHDDELLSRKMFVKEMKGAVSNIESTLRSQRTISKIEGDERKKFMRRNKKENRMAREAATAQRDEFVQNQVQQQEQIIEVQDQHLEGLENSLYRVRTLGEAIGTEIESQNVALDELDNDLTATMGGMEVMLGKMDKLLKTKNRFQTWTILMLMLVVFILAFLVAYT